MPEMRVTSINLVKLTDVPVTVKNTEMSRVVESVHDAIKSKGLTKDNALSFPVANAKKYTRYQLQSRLQKLGHKVLVLQRGETFFVRFAETDGPKPKR